MQKRVDRVCEFCGKSFMVPAYKVALGFGIYCSHACMHKGRYAPAEERFWANIDKGGPNDCWLWTGCTRKGYGVLYANGRSQYAHRFSYELVHGPIPAGLLACHKCDNPACCNPKHICFGTIKDNTRDAASKRRMPRGESHHNSKLTEKDVRQIRSDSLAGLASYSVLAKRYGVSKQLIYRIVKRKAWKLIA